MSTIASIITAPGNAAVSIIKISGEQAWAIAEKLSDKTFKHRYIELAWVKNANNENLDQVLVLPFKAPNSYTGEDLIELHSHGGSWITEKILERVLEAGAKLAKPGEFTERAFLNQKLDLSQAEGILDIINARSSSAGDNAIKLYQGFLGSEIQSIRLELLNIMGEVTASIDFPDEVGDFDRPKYQSLIDSQLSRIDKLLAGEEEGHILRNGYKVALIGNPNAGKSTLLNALLKKERAIVTDIAGTTRDVIEEAFSIKGLPIILLDTAGLRESLDTVERIGIEKTKEIIKEADLVISLQDMNLEEDLGAAKLLEAKRYIKVGTKKDTLPQHDGINYDLCISAMTGEGIEELKEKIYKTILAGSQSDSAVKVNHRQADLLRKAKTALMNSRKAAENEPEDFWTIDLRAAIAALGEITGETLTEELLDNIFSRFCIGK